MIILLCLMTNTSGEQQCTPGSSHSQSCGQKGKSILPTETCCAPCCLNNTTNHCGRCSTERCLSPDYKPPWSKAYWNSKRKRVFVVLQRPFSWLPPKQCTCGAAGGNRQIGSVLSLDPPAKSKQPSTPGWEEWPGHIGKKYLSQYGCCDAGDEWRTRVLYCEFHEQCADDTVTFEGSATEPAEAITVTVLEKAQGSDAMLCSPRLEKKLLAEMLRTQYLQQWLQHYRSRSVQTFTFYSDDCAGDKIPPTLGDSINIVDISSIGEYPGWYHHQILAIKDCWARASAAEHSWTLFVDLDELLLIPRGWTTASIFQSHQGLSFGSYNPCDTRPYDAAPCQRVWKGHRKYALRTDVATHTAPQYIHGHPLEHILPVSSGIFIAHLKRCAISNISNMVKVLSKEASLSDLEMNGGKACPPEKDNKGDLLLWRYD
jgi:hypothetical protein